MKSQNPLIKQRIKNGSKSKSHRFDQNPKAIDLNGKKVTKLQLELTGSRTYITFLELLITKSRPWINDPTIGEVERAKALVPWINEDSSDQRSERLKESRPWNNEDSRVEMRERESCDEMRERVEMRVKGTERREK